MGRDPLRRAPALGPRGWVVVASLAAGAWAAWRLRLDPAGLLPGPGGLALLRDFLGAALRPALAWEGGYVPAGTRSVLGTALEGAGRTVLFAAAAMALALALAVPLGFLASSAWWSGEAAGARTRAGRAARRALLPALQGGTRVVLATIRSVHELLWAVLFLAAFGLAPANAVLAIAIPYAGVLAKVFSEMVDEAPRDAALALRATGGSALQVFCVGLLPRALPDLAAYAFYRFECALRSAAVLGFFGFPTLGYHLRLSFQASHYGEVWTFLYVLVALIVVVELWSGALRRRIVA